jgi:hypothetical protein
MREERIRFIQKEAPSGGEQVPEPFLFLRKGSGRDTLSFLAVDNISAISLSGKKERDRERENGAKIESGSRFVPPLPKHREKGRKKKRNVSVQPLAL